MKPLPKEWNKQFHFVRIRTMPERFIERLFPKETYTGYMWPTNNWVECHCFERKEEKVEYTNTENDVTVNIIDEGKGNLVPSPHHHMAKGFWSKNTHFHNRKKSFVISREKVSFSWPNVIYCTPSKEDFKRWKDWHPKDNYLTRFEGGNKDWYYIEWSGREPYRRKIEGNSIGPQEPFKF